MIIFIIIVPPLIYSITLDVKEYPNSLTKLTIKWIIIIIIFIIIFDKIYPNYFNLIKQLLCY